MKEILHFESNEDRHAFLLGYVKVEEFKEAKKVEKKAEHKAEPKSEPKKTTKKKGAK